MGEPYLKLYDNPQVLKAMDYFFKELYAATDMLGVPVYSNFIEIGRTMQNAVHQNAINHGWWDSNRSDGELIALQHAELSECLESLRDGNPESVKIPGHCHAVEELADVVIRIMDHCEARGWNLFSAIAAKHEFNKGREYKHGGKEF